MTAVVLAACTSAPPATDTPLRFDGGGAAVVGTGLRIDFGRAEAGVIETVSRLKGTAPAARFGPDLCGPGISAVRYPDRLWLIFNDGAFTGWTRPGPNGVGVEAVGDVCEMPVL